MSGRKVINADETSMDSASMETQRMERPAIERWSPGNMLETPRVTGDYVVRWIREYINGQPDPRNVQSALREGYQRVKMGELDEMDLAGVDEDAGDGAVRAGGLLLMKLPKEFARQRREYYARKSLEASMAVDKMQGVPVAHAVHEDRGSRALDGAEAGSALRKLATS